MTKLRGYQCDVHLYESLHRVIFRGRKEEENKPVIIKLLKGEYPTTEQLARIHHEYSILHHLDEVHGIYAHLDLVECDNSKAIITDDIGGQALDQLIKKAGKISVDTTLEIAVELCRFLKKVHDNHIIHRDIKPHNIIYNSKTGQVRLVDFSLSTRASKASQEAVTPDHIEGTLQYMSPEQTGRMNRFIDYRTDFYSLGATLYEMLTGTLPFDSNDPMEIIHCHIARKPKPACEIVPDIPEMVSRIVMKLLNKNAEDRYQSCDGLWADLDRCRDSLVEHSTIKTFELGTKDTLNRFQIPEKLYGRQSEVDQLMECFDRVSEGGQETLLVKGQSGIGKSALVSEIHQSILERKGFFVSGRYEQYKRNIPYTALTQAFQSLIRQILTQPDDLIALWKEKILGAVGKIGRVIIDVIPQVELIIGEQPEVQELPAQETLNRFNLVFQRFLRVFANSNHPLVVFIDDLQWADHASLQLLPTILTDPSLSAFLFIGAHRDTEVDDDHPLSRMLESAAKKGSELQSLTLGPLDRADIRKMVADTIDVAPDTADLLTEIVHQKTGGNPFFMTEFLKTLDQQKLLHFNGVWQADIARIRELTITDNVVELMAGKIGSLPKKAQGALKLASCLGGEFYPHILAAVTGAKEPEVLGDLAEAFNEGMVIQAGNAYRFVHEGIRMAASSMLTGEEAEKIHYRIGQTLLTLPRSQPHEDHAFSIIDHLSRCKSWLSESELDQFKELNLLAAKTSKARGAWDAALRFLDNVQSQFTESSWKEDYRSTLEYYEELAENLYMSVRHTEFLRTARLVLANARSDLDKVRIHKQLINYYTNQLEYEKAIETGVRALASLGAGVPSNPSELAALPEIIKIKFKTRGKKASELLELPKLEDDRIHAINDLLQEIGAPAYIFRPNLLPILAARIVLNSLKYSNSLPSSYSYAAYGFILAGVFGEIERGYEFGQLAARLAEEFGDVYWLGKTFYLMHMVCHWKDPLQVNIDHLENVISHCQESGDHQILGWCFFQYPFQLFAKGEALEKVDREVRRFENDVKVIGQPFSALICVLFGRFYRTLSNPTGDPRDFTGEDFDERGCLEELETTRNRTGLAYYATLKTITLFLNKRFDEASHVAYKYEEYVSKGCVSQINHPLFYFYFGLSLICSIQKSKRSTIKNRRTFRSILKKFKKWGAHNHHDYHHKFLILEAMNQMVIERKPFDDILKIMNQAIQVASENKYIHDVGIANELVAICCCEVGMDKLKEMYLNDAFYHYQKWGCSLKTNQLKIEYPTIQENIMKEQALAPITSSTSADSGAIMGQMLDLKSVLDATQALSSTIKMESLLAQIIKIVIESGGGEKGYLVLIGENDSQTVVKAQVESDQWFVVKKPMDESVEVAQTVIRYVIKTREILLLSDASKDKNYSFDHHVKKHNVRSILCVPLINQARLIGLLYLENNLSADAFTTDRVDMLKVLSTQAAISLENAQLYSNMENKVIERTQELEKAQKEMLDIAHRAGMAEIAANVLHNIGNILNSVTTSANLIRTEVKGSRMSTIGRANNLIRENMDNLEEFLFKDNRGKKLIQLYFGIEKAFEKEQESVADNLDRLDHHIEAVKEIVDAQQSYAEGGLFFEQVSLSDMIDKMLILKNETTQVQGIKVIKKFKTVPKVSVQRAKLLHVLVNLFENSVEAMQKLPEEEKELKFTLSSENSSVYLKIEDNGDGIDSVADIFGHGTVTKRDGKGFGLHGCAVAIKEMKGNIAAETKSNGQGALFTLSFPVE